MSSKDKENIQQMEQAEYNFTCTSYLKKVHQKCLKNQLVSQIDIFSLPIKLNINGQQEFKTVFGGFIHLALVGICIMLAYIVLYPNGFSLTSQITQVGVILDKGNNGQSLFDHTQELISFKFFNAATNAQVSVAQYLQVFAYQILSNGQNKSLQISTNCTKGEFCLKDTSSNKGLAIYGSPHFPSNPDSKVVFELVWCDQSNVVTCITLNHNMQLIYSNFFKQKCLGLTEFKTTYFTKFMNNLLINQNATRQNFVSNNKIMGHMSNVFPQTINTYHLSQNIVRQLNVNPYITLSGYDTNVYAAITYTITSSGETNNIVQTFDDIISPILFFLSVKQTLYFLVFLFFVKQYNKNSGFLKVGSSIFYVNNLQTKKMYHFDKGYETFLACFLRGHFLFNAINFILKKFGKTLYDYIPNKSICAISLMNKAEILLQENNFYKKLNDLTLMENQAPRKIPFTQEQQKKTEENQENNSQTQQSFFEDENMDQNTKIIHKEAFKQFCQDNGYIQMKRKKAIYYALTNNKLKHVLNFEMQRQFKNYLRNVKCQRKGQETLGQSSFSEQNNEIKIQVHDMSNNQLTAGQLMQGKRKDSF